MDVVAQGWGWRHGGRAAWALCDVSFTIAAGERVLLLGGSGSGKSTLLHALAGVLGGADEGEEAGRILVGGKHPTRQHGHVGLVMQDPESQVVLARVGDDVAFGCENLGLDRDEIWRRVRESLEAVGLNLPLEHSTSALSGGEKQRLAIAGALAMGAEVLLLDEPTANLDPAGIRDVRDTIARVVDDRRTTLVVVEHRVDVWADLVDRVIVLSPDGGLLADGTPTEVFGAHSDHLLRAGVWVPGAPLPEPIEASVGSASILETRDLTLGFSPRRPVRSGVDERVPDARSTMITGANGAGKTTLALTLAGLLPPLAGAVVAADHLRPPAEIRVGWAQRRRRIEPAHPHTWASRDLLTRIGTVFQEPEHQFVSATVSEEIGVGLRALGWSRANIDTRVSELLEILHLTTLARANPFTLSGGEKRRLSVGTVLATAPRVIVLDEPTFGQDRNTWTDLVALVRAMIAEGRTVISVTHDRAFIDTLGQHHIRLGVADD
ncbi:MAG TPA: ABC transporter ATP-binding protein [Propionibacteriaceae bacterium]|nr:ABC transporter ATP-binding protein [Propionibacteriaceae bacterium]